jgi:hypothetical protein
MDTYVPYVEEKFLDELKANFYSELLESYKNLGPVGTVKSEIEKIFAAPNVKQSGVAFTYTPLELGSDEEQDSKLAAANIRRLYESLSVLTPSQAAMEKIWVALLNTYYLDYHLHVIRQLQGSRDVNQRIYDRTFLKGPVISDKRRLVINNLSLLWWIGHYTYDKANTANPYHLTEFFVSTPYRGNSVAFFSSNIHGNRNITLGILDGIKQLADDQIIEVNRFAYTNSSKIMNLVAGVKLVDLMTRQDVKRLVVQELPGTNNVILK